MTAGGASPELARRLERLGAETWPAETVEMLGGWLLGFTRGVTRRANSALPLGWDDGDVAAAVAEVETRYAARGLPPCFKLTDAALPGALDRLLAARGYRAVGRSRVMTAAAASVAPAGHVAELRLAPDPDPAWCALAWPVDEASRDEAVVRAGIVSRIRAPRTFATVRLDGRTAGGALGAIVDGWCCITAVRTLPAFRRRGVARAAVGGLAAWAAGQGAPRLCLQVESDNTGAIALYESAGFRHAYDYHYRTR